MSENLRPTPETDAAEAAFVADWNRHRQVGWPSSAAVTKGFDKARIFERQRDVARENTKAWHGEYRALNDLHRELGLKHKEALRQRDEARYQLATATARAERAEARLREFCRENPSRWKRLELMDLRDQLREALEACDAAMEYMSEYDIPITLPAQVKAAIEAAKAHEKEMEAGHRACDV